MSHKVRSPAYRAIRGGSWYSHAQNARAAYLLAVGPSRRAVNLGLRLMRRCS